MVRAFNCRMWTLSVKFEQCFLYEFWNLLYRSWLSSTTGALYYTTIFRVSSGVLLREPPIDRFLSLVSDPSFLCVSLKHCWELSCVLWVVSGCGSWLHWMSHEGASWDTLDHTEKRLRTRKEEESQSDHFQRSGANVAVDRVSWWVRCSASTGKPSAAVPRLPGAGELQRLLFCTVKRDYSEPQPLKPELQMKNDLWPTWHMALHCGMGGQSHRGDLLLCAPGTLAGWVAK